MKKQEKHISQGIAISKPTCKGHQEIQPQSVQFGDNA